MFIDQFPRLAAITVLWLENGCPLFGLDWCPPLLVLVLYKSVANQKGIW